MKSAFSFIFMTPLLLLLFHGGCMTKGKMTQFPEIFQKILTLDSGLKLRYAISLPKSLSPDNPAPLVLALHYGGPVTPFYGKGFLTLLVEPALRDLEAIIIAPDCPGRGWVDPNSERAVMVLIENILNDYKINPKKIIVTGYSLGGIGAWHYAARHPQLFSAAIPISAVPDLKAIPTVEGVPIYAIHSRNDEIFPIEKVRRFVKRQKSKGASVRLIEVRNISHYETSRFVQPLKEAIPWIKKIWKDTAKK